MARDQSRYDADQIARRTRRVVRGGLQAEGEIPRRHGAREVSLSRERPRAGALCGAARHPRAARRHARAARLGADHGGREHHRARRRHRRRRDLARARRPVRTVRRAGRQRAPDRERTVCPSGAGARGGASARYRLPRARHDAALDPRRHPDDAEGPLQDHDRLHAEGRHARPRHDVPHLHGADEPRLLLRSRHGAKMRVALALQPVATALFANSPFTEGKPNGFLSFRSEIWRDTDNARAGMLPWVFEDGMGFERYADYALDVPMYFIKRGDSYIDVSGKSFRDHLDGKLRAGRARDHLRLGQPRLDDLSGGSAQALHRDARLRWRAVAAPAVAAGVLGRADLRRRQSRRLLGDREGLDRRRSGRSCATTCRKLGFKAKIRNRTLLDIAGETLQLAGKGPGPPPAARPQRPRRDALSASAAGKRRPRHHARGRAAGRFQRAVERLGRSRSSSSWPIERLGPSSPHRQGADAGASAVGPRRGPVQTR